MNDDMLVKLRLRCQIVALIRLLPTEDQYKWLKLYELECEKWGIKTGAGELDDDATL